MKGRANYLSYMTGAYLFFYYMEASLRWPLFKSIRFHFLFGAILTFLCLIKFYQRKNTDLLRYRKSLPVDEGKKVLVVAYSLLAVMGLYVLFSLDRTESWSIYLDRVLKLSLISFFIVASVDSIKDLKVIVAFLLLGWFKISSEAFLGWATGSLMWESQGVQRLHGASPFVGHPNSLSAFALGCMAFAFCLWGAAENWIERGVLASLIFFGSVCIVFTASRSGYVVVFCVVFYLFFKLVRRNPKLFLLGGISLIVLLPLIPEQYYSRFESIYTGKEAEGNSSGTRLQIIKDAWDIYQTYPFGIGVQAFSKVREDMFDRTQNIHMLYLEVLTNIGPVGFVLFFLLVKRILDLNKLSRARLQALPKELKEFVFLKALALAVSVFIIFRLIFGLFAMDLYEPHWWLAMGFSLAIYKLVNLYEINNNKLTADENV